MAIKSSIHVERIPLDGSNVKSAIAGKCTHQASRDDARRLVSTFVVSAVSGPELILIFELYDQTL